ncbi:alpha/beta hydrolase [Jongsikchunia kroppenstedtii]|uniref:alpha/beta hydrolase n=1 Tax=Jongsikchunia kroppenstedtii TaxID=1121721 RepID=UPI00037136EA|nr:alpha/beta hydrolase [Jongsikchunia kroppenstedtii]
MHLLRRVPLLSFVAVLGLLVAACGSSGNSSKPAASSTTAASSSASASSSPDLSRYYDQKLNWVSCDKFLTGGDYPADRTDCARMSVPVDYTKPDGPQAKIAVFRLKASGDKVGSLITNPGGPGGSGLEFMAGQAKKFAGMGVSKNFDIIGFDPRGIGASTPTIRCETDKQRDKDRATNYPGTQAGVAAQEARNRQFAQECKDKMGSEFLEHAGTADVVQDIDVLRAVLGDQKLNWLGFSYGTRIGTEYAAKFPTHVRAMINDGAVDPAEDQIDENIRQNAAFQSAFNDYAAACARAADCPLGTDPAQATARFQQLTRPLLAKPARTADPRGLSYGDAITGTTQALYSQDYWDYLTKGLTELVAGRGDTLLKLADSYDDRRPDGTYGNIQDAFTVIHCVDDTPITAQADVNRLDVEGRKAAPYRDDGTGTGLGARDECAFWPVPPTMSRGVPEVSGLPKTVVVSTTGDPATPYQSGVNLARDLGAELVTHVGTQHTASFDGDACLDDPLTQYLVTLKPPAGLTCK